MSGRILVTGAAGFIGSHVVKQLAATGIAVRATTRKPEGAGFLKEMGDVEIVKMDLLDVGSVKAAVEGCQDIIHCAAELYIASKDPQRDVLDPSIKGVQNLIIAMEENGVERLIHTSSVSAIRRTHYKNGITFTHDDWCDDANLKNNPYGFAKSEAERIVRKWAEGKECRLVTIHPSVVFGKPLAPRHIEGSMSYLKHFLKGPPFVLDININFVDVEDVARAHVAALDKGVDRGRYIVHSGNMWMKEIGELLKSEFPERKWSRRRLPNVLAYIIAIFHPKLNFKMLKDGLGKYVEYDASTQSELIGDVKKPEEIIIETMRDLLSQD